MILILRAGSEVVVEWYGPYYSDDAVGERNLPRTAPPPPSRAMLGLNDVEHPR
jgi:hypothetical protein